MKDTEKYRQARKQIEKGEALVVRLDDIVTLVSTKELEAGERRYNEYLLSRRAIYGKAN